MANQEFQIQNIEKPKRKFWKFMAGFLGIIVLAVGGFFVWDKYLSPQAKSQRQTEKQYEAYMKWEERYKQAMREDTYGGKTPEETLQMFIEALEKEDIELASKYFALDTNENSEYYLMRIKWEKGLRKTKEAGEIKKIIDVINKSKFNSLHSSNDTVWFILANKQGIVEYSIILKFNKESSVWKIESM